MDPVSPNRNAELVLIGCGTPTPTPERFGSSLVLKIGSEHLMFDCGPATTYKLKRAGIAPTDISHLFFTHHHYDHNADYPCFLLCRWDHETAVVPRLKVCGPPPTELITQRLIGPRGAFADDWRVRIELPASQQIYSSRGGQVPRPEPRFDIQEIEAGDRIETGSAVVTAGVAVHLQPLMDCLAYRTEWDGGSLVVTGDAGRNESIEAFAQGADTLVVNVWDHQEKMSPAMTSGFCGTRDAALLAAAADVSRLVITHQGPDLCHPGSKEKAIADIADVFKGEIVFGEELMKLNLDTIKKRSVS